jgi:alpha-ribazole phosphatase
MNFGAWEGQRWADIARAELDAWTADFWGYRVGGSGESVGAFMSRVAAAFDALPWAENTLWITHAGVIRAVRLIASGQRRLQRADQWPVAAPAYGQWCKLDAPSKTQKAPWPPIWTDNSL